jgi:hypothetical protein
MPIFRGERRNIGAGARKSASYADDGRAVDVRQRLQEKLRQHERELREERLRADDLAAAEAAEHGDKKKKKKQKKKKKKDAEADAEADAGAAPRKIRVGEASWTNPDGTQRTIPAGEYDEREWLAQCFEQQLGWADAMKHPARERAAEATEDSDSDADASVQADLGGASPLDLVALMPRPRNL